MKNADRKAPQRGSILLVAVVSILTVALVAAGLNALRDQNANTFVQTIEAMQNTSVLDSVSRFDDEDLQTYSNRENVEEEIRKYLYDNQDSS